MASIFTFDPDPPRVSSPWKHPPLEPDAGGAPQQDAIIATSSPLTAEGNRIPRRQLRNAGHDNSITRLEAEPQDGPTEYKLHLLLRRRRSFLSTSTGPHVSGSLRRIEPPLAASAASRSASEACLSGTPPPLSSIQSRQHRLEQLTTQLLWRLQQSCSHHLSSSNIPVLPQLPDESQLAAQPDSQRVLPGLEDSKGALYEIGVADDGTLVGLASDEMDESLDNLRAMAMSLGCCVQVTRKVEVGHCEWIENVERAGGMQQETKTGPLWVAEAFVHPDLTLIKREPSNMAQKDSSGLARPLADSSHSSSAPDLRSPTEQLRASLTGATMSGKSSLLGSLSTATLDNGRGKSRLNSLKHQHEIASGLTSSVTQELIGYHDITDQQSGSTSSQVINYDSRNVSSWLDIHAAAKDGRLAFLSDSAGHPRYRRTTVRGLVGWSPHWTLLCVPADSAEEVPGKSGTLLKSHEGLGVPPADVDLSQALLQLCLKLELPLVVIITKLDLATKSGLRSTLSKLLSTLKEVGRKPQLISGGSSRANESELGTISSEDLAEARDVVRPLKDAPLATVPILLSSAVTGAGINKLHALLRVLPIPDSPDSTKFPHSALFHIEDVYGSTPSSSDTAIIGGHLCFGTFRIGDELLLGPYPLSPNSDDSDSGSGNASTPPKWPRRNSPMPTSRSFPGALEHRRASRLQPEQDDAYDKQSEWRRVRITSLRNLRLSVHCLQAGQAGTVGVAPLDLPIMTPALTRVRKGMVLVEGGDPKAHRVVSVRFSGTDAEGVRSLTIGSAVVVYVASVRASAKLVSVAPELHGPDINITPDLGSLSLADDEEDGFDFNFDGDEPPAKTSSGHSAPDSATIATFKFLASREFVHAGDKVLILPGGGPVLYGGTERGEKGVAGFDGFVGRVVEGYR